MFVADASAVSERDGGRGRRRQVSTRPRAAGQKQWLILPTRRPSPTPRRVLPAVATARGAAPPRPAPAPPPADALLRHGPRRVGIVPAFARLRG